MGITQEIGNAGESLVAKYLQQKGFIISTRNYHSKYGEIDIIAENNDLILFVEVKSRSSVSHGRPMEFVDKRKRHKIYLTANIYMRRNAVCLQPRFDVAEVFVNKNGSTDSMEINYIENAFGADAGEKSF